MTSFHPVMRRALLLDSKHRKKDVFKITEHTLQSIGLGDDQRNLREQVGSIIDKRFRGREKFLKALRTTIKDEKILKEYEQRILDHAERTGLTSEQLLEYEGWVAQLYYLTQYPDPQKPFNIVTLFERIENFKNDSMPNFDSIRKRWVEKQENAIKKKYHDLNPLNLIKLSLKFLWIWYLAATFCKIFKFAKFKFCREREPGRVVD